MIFATQFGAFVIAPLMMFSSWLGFGGFAHADTLDRDHTATSTTPWTATSTSQWIHNWFDNRQDKNDREVDKESNKENKDNNNTDKEHVGTTTTSTSSIHITTESPKFGPVGTEVTLTGKGFTSDSLVHFGIGAMKSTSVSTDGTKLTFKVPSSIGPYCKAGIMCPMYMQLIVKAHTYPVFVDSASSTQHKYERSNRVNFRVTGDTDPTPASNVISINGIDAPATLAMNTSGTWTLHVTSSSALQGNLHYSVVWGDERTGMLAAFRAEDPFQIQSSATFTHSYDEAGTYKPVFTVSDDAGHRVTSSATVLVTPQTFL